MSWAGTASALPSAEFRYLRDEGAAQCPSGSELRAAVSARLGYDPFENGAKRTIRVSIETLSEGFRARVELEGGDEGPAKREIVTKGSCLELVSAVALSISLAIDAERSGASAANGSAAAGPEASTPEPAAVLTAAAPVPALEPKRERGPNPKPRPPTRATSFDEAERPDEPVATRRRSPHVSLPFDFAVGSRLQLITGSAPSTALGALIFVQARRKWLSVDLELRADAPAGTALPTTGNGVGIETGVVAFQLAPCAHFQLIKVCGVGALGELWASSRGLPTKRTDLALYSAVGLRLGFEWPQNAAWALSFHGDVLALLSHVQVVMDSRQVWSAPSSFGSLGAGGLVRF